MLSRTQAEETMPLFCQRPGRKKSKPNRANSWALKRTGYAECIERPTHRPAEASP